MGKKFAEAVLHFGSDKTGSTTIQTLFDSARGRLVQDGTVAYPPGLHHAQLGSCFSHAPESYAFNREQGAKDRAAIRAADERYFQELSVWLEAVPPCRILLFSYEGFITLEADAILKMREFCLQYADEVRALMFVRAPLSYAISALSQRVKQGRLGFPRDLPPVCDYKGSLTRLLAVFPRDKVSVHPFYGMSKDADVLDRFCGLLGIERSRLGLSDTLKGRLNEGLSQEAVAVGEALIEELSRTKVVYSEKEFNLRMGQFLGLISGDRVKLTKEQAEIVQERSRPHCEFLAVNFDVRFEEESDNFVASDAAGPPVARDLLRSFGRMLAGSWWGYPGREDFRDERFVIVGGELFGQETVDSGAVLHCKLRFSVKSPLSDLDVSIQVLDLQARIVLTKSFSMIAPASEQLLPGIYDADCYLVADLNAGSYSIGAGFTGVVGGLRQELAWYGRLLRFEVRSTDSVEVGGYARIPAELVVRRTEDTTRSLISNASGTIQVHGTLGSMRIWESVEVGVSVTNESPEIWRGTQWHGLFVSYHWIDSAGNVAVWDGERTPFSPPALAPNETCDLRARVVGPGKTGRYRLVLLALQERSKWFDEIGLVPAALDVEVTAPHAPLRYCGADARLSSEVGVRDGEVIVTTGRAGFLLFGPYAYLDPGTYDIRIYGDSENWTAGVLMDAVCHSGKKPLVILDRVENSDDLLACGQFDLHEVVGDLEVRIWVDPAARLRISKLVITRNSASAPTASQM